MCPWFSNRIVFHYKCQSIKAVVFYKKRLVLASFQLTQEFSSQVPVSLPNRPPRVWVCMVHSPEFSFPRWIVVNLEQTFPIHLAPTWRHGSALSSLQTGSWKNSRKHPKLRRTSCSSSGRQKKFQFFCFCLSHGKFQYLVVRQVFIKKLWKSFFYRMEILNFSQLTANQLHNKALVWYFLQKWLAKTWKFH